MHEQKGFSMKKIFIILFLIPFSLSGNSEEITENKADITIESQHIVIETIDGELIVTDAVLLNIYNIGNLDETISLSIPEGFTNLELLSGLNEDSLIKEKGRIRDTRKIQEGKRQIAFRYKLRIKGDTYHLPLNIYYDTRVFYLLVKNLELNISGEHLFDEGLLDMGKGKYHAFSVESLKKGEKTEISIYGLGRQGRRQKILVIAVPLFIVLIILVIYILKKGKSEELIPTPSDALIEKKKTLISTLANLDEEFENGEIDESTYMELRKEYKEKLKKIILKIENG